MRRALPLLGVLSFSPLMALAAIDADLPLPDQGFLFAYQAFVEARKLDASPIGAGETAREKFREAEHWLESIKKTYPKWNPTVVEYRLQLVRTELASLKTAPEQTPAAPAQPAQAEPESDPQPLFLLAYTAYQKGEKLESARDRNRAVDKYREAGDLLKVIKAHYPSWNPTIVDYRVGRIVEALKRLEAKE